jgi:hypothetical protein
MRDLVIIAVGYLAGFGVRWRIDAVAAWRERKRMEHLDPPKARQSQIEWNEDHE